VTPSQGAEAVYKAAEAVKAAYDAVNRIPFNKRAALDALLDGPVFPGDLDTLAKKLNVLADEWQGELDAAPEPPPGFEQWGRT
jgi:hypothetical protein